MVERGGAALPPRWQGRLDGSWELLGGAEDSGQSDRWQTPAGLVGLLAGLCGPEGYLDPAGSEGSAMTRRAAVAFCPPLADAFEPEIRWPALPVLCNPPWSQTGRWVRLLLQRAKGPIALVAPLRLDTVWARELAPTVVLVPPSRLKYTDPATGLVDGSPRTSSCVYLRGVGPFSRGAREHRALFARERWTEWAPRR